SSAGPRTAHGPARVHLRRDEREDRLHFGQHAAFGCERPDAAMRAGESIPRQAPARRLADESPGDANLPPPLLPRPLHAKFRAETSALTVVARASPSYPRQRAPREDNS